MNLPLQVFINLTLGSALSHGFLLFCSRTMFASVVLHRSRGKVRIAHPVFYHAHWLIKWARGLHPEYLPAACRCASAMARRKAGGP